MVIIEGKCSVPSCGGSLIVISKFQEDLHEDRVSGSTDVIRFEEKVIVCTKCRTEVGKLLED